ncbi:hypothetical protein F7734_36245 [Scytonema sp. UIC 10036]|uniref:hypothetical protein n=1 Tax=Scytonema sp. UIC 10036 TaxID=2304196 RepID=UPI0012DA1B50|nr:hypothetical protein [Scytonema sp. UIC 10036]MUG97483.1 hypothetical protein [Scytonema sp. UIC 10036]
MRGEQNLCLLSSVDSQMFTANPPETSADLAIALLIHYSFDLSGYSAIELVELWQRQYPGNWLHLAVIEALYQGRYKAISVQQILTCWQRRGQTIFHFNMEFERLICSKFPQSLTASPKLSPATAFTLGYEETNQQVAESLPETVPLQTPDVEAIPVETHELNTSVDFMPEQEEISPFYPEEVLPVSTNNPPIGQFTPETRAGSESFTSKLKAISYEESPSRRLLSGRGLQSSVV